MSNSRSKNFSGFTLVEMIISVGIFSMVMVVTIGALLQIVAANRQAQAIKSVLNNINMAVEDMTRTIKNGTKYDCDPSDSDIDDCSSTPGNRLGLSNENGAPVVYSFSNGQIVKTEGGVGQSITASEANIDRLNFYVSGKLNNIQPNVFVSIGGEVRYRKNLTTRFDMQTLAVQRKIDR